MTQIPSKTHPRINEIVVFVIRQLPESIGSYSNDVQIGRGAKWVAVETSNSRSSGYVRAQPSHTYYDVTPASMARVFLCQMKLMKEARGQ